jgi:NADH-quinone oxidoreductase subunit C
VAGTQPPGAAISLRQTLQNSKWSGTICPKCGNQLSVGDQVVLCPKCYTPHHAQCWQDNGSRCAVDETPARIIVRAGQSLQPAVAPQPSPTAAVPPAGTPGAGEAPDAPTSATPRQPTPSADTDPAAQGRPGVPARPEVTGAPRPEAAAGARPAPPRAGPGAAAPGAAAAGARGGRPAAGRAAASPTVREALGLRTLADVRQRLESVLSDLSPQFDVSVDEVTCTVPAEQIEESARRAKEHESLRFDYLRCLSAVDYQQEGIEVVYHLYSTRLLQKCVLKARVPGEGHSLPSVTRVWSGANWHEREAAEMFNIRFDGHPYLEPILLQRDETGRIVPGPILLKRFPLRPKEPPGIYGFPEED